MRHIKLFEDVNSTSLEEVIKVLKTNTMLASVDFNKISEDMVNEVGNFIYVELPDQWTEGKSHHMGHFNKNKPGSHWSISPDELKKVILETLKKKETTIDGPRIKWLNQKSTKNVGFDNLVKVEGSDKTSKSNSYEKFGLIAKLQSEENKEAAWAKIQNIANSNNYELVNGDNDEAKKYTFEDFKEGKDGYIKQEIGFIEVDGDEKQETNLYNLILAKSGELNGKSIVNKK